VDSRITNRNNMSIMSQLVFFSSNDAYVI
jgi:hypothetical protein